MAVPKIRQPAQASTEALFTVRHGITGMRLTKPLASLPEADTAAIRLSTEKPHTVEVWHRDRMIAWYAHGVRG
jgi:hypothetical protein